LHHDEHDDEQQREQRDGEIHFGEEFEVLYDLPLLLPGGSQLLLFLIYLRFFLSMMSGQFWTLLILFYSSDRP
jgi:hypothetical protein